MSTNDVALLDKARLQGSPATLARPLPFGYDNPAMDPSDPAALFTPRFLPPSSQNAWCPVLAQGLGGSPGRVDVPVGAEGQPAATQGGIPPVAPMSAAE